MFLCFLFKETMLRTKNLINDITCVPHTWVFEHYLKLSEKLKGQDVNFSSIFNKLDKKPSFFVFYSKEVGKYYWKDFSVGKSGDGIALVQAIYNLAHRFEATALIVKDYNQYVLDNNIEIIEPMRVRDHYKLLRYRLRDWTKLDQEYWTQFKISSKLLTTFKVKPLHSFQIAKDGSPNVINVRTNNLYGYFYGENHIYKIYQPLNPDYKFFKVCDYIQGSEQLTRKKPYLVICSSLKDLMVFNTLGFSNAEAVAPDSENVIIPAEIINEYKKTYQGITTLFDNDAAGIIAMENYLTQFHILSTHFKYEKDLADCVKVHGINNTRELLQPVLSATLKQSQINLKACDIFQ